MSHCWSGSGRILFPLGRRLSHCVRNYDFFCGTTGIICQRTRTEWCGGRGAPITGTEGRKTGTIFGLSCFVVWGSFGPEPHVGPPEHELLPFVMHAYRTSVHESTGYSPFRLMMGEECSLPQDVTTDELRTNREHDVAPHPFATWVWDALEVAYDHVRHSLQCTAARRKCLYDIKAVNRKFPVGSWVLRYYPPAAQKKLGSPWVGPQQVVRQATGHTVGIQKGPDTPIIFIHVDDLKVCPAPQKVSWTPGSSTAKSLCTSTVAFRPGSDISDYESTPSVIVSTYNNASHTSTRNNRRPPELSTTPTLQQMFALARRMGYEMRPIARQTDGD